MHCGPCRDDHGRVVLTSLDLRPWLADHDLARLRGVHSSWAVFATSVSKATYRGPHTASFLRGLRWLPGLRIIEISAVGKVGKVCKLGNVGSAFAEFHGPHGIRQFTLRDRGQWSDDDWRTALEFIGQQPELRFLSLSGLTSAAFFSELALRLSPKLCTLVCSVPSTIDATLGAAWRVILTRCPHLCRIQWCRGVETPLHWFSAPGYPLRTLFEDMIETGGIAAAIWRFRSETPDMVELYLARD